MRPLRLSTLLAGLNALLVLAVGAVMVLAAAPLLTGLGEKEARFLAVGALVAAVVATVAGFALSRRVAEPLRELTRAAERIGRGDLETPLPPATGVEVGTLAATMEEMRRRLLQLTAELKRRQAEAEAVLTGIREGVLAVDRDRRIRYLNPLAASLLAIAPEAAIGRFCGDVLNPRKPDGTRPCDDDCPIVHARFRGGARATEHWQLPDGLRRTVVVTSAPPTEDRQFLLLRDETDVEASRRLRDAVLANVSHEFRTPLAAQLASIELLRDRLAEDGAAAPALELVTSLERGSLRLTQLVDNLLESVRIEAGQLGIRRRPVNLDEVVEEAAEALSPLLAQRRQRLEVELPFPLPAIEGDAPRLAQVFVNLLANANKYAPEGSTIRVGGRVEEPGAATSVVLWVDDEGPGLPPGNTAAVFGRFFRAAAEEPEEGGMGLGLAIVRSIVERHGGQVEAERRAASERGSRFAVRLPIAAGPRNKEAG